jgi:hypothetical protein
MSTIAMIPGGRRFITKDPTRIISEDVNIFEFVQNNPTNFIDPDGLYLQFVVNHPFLQRGLHYVQMYAQRVFAFAKNFFQKGTSCYQGEGGIRFGQQGISSTFRHGEFAGKTIEEVVAGIRSGAIKIDQLPIQVITRDNITYTLNNRSLMAIRQAGMEPTVVKNVTGNAFFEKQLTERLGEMGRNLPAILFR